MTKEKQRDLGLLLLRIGVGLSFIYFHGWPKLIGGPARWERVGSAMVHVGVSFAPTFWGVLATGTELIGGALLIVGLMVRPVAFMLAGTMAVATTMHLGVGDGWKAHPIEMGIVFVGLSLIGGGGYSLDAKWRGKS